MALQAVSWRSGKTHRDENFPVASRVVRARHRPAILAFYRFARAADDIADAAGLDQATKHELLDGMEAGLLGRQPHAEAAPLRAAILQGGLDFRHPLDLLAAFRLDVDKARYADWADLMHYCSLSAMPVGRFVLDLHGESRGTWGWADPLCAALQIINHLQDCGDDYRRLDRVYLPLDILDQHGARPDALGARRTSAPLQACIRDLARRSEALVAESRPLAGRLADAPLACEVGAIRLLALRLSRRLVQRDPLAGRVGVRASDQCLAAVGGVPGALLARRRDRKRTAAPHRAEMEQPARWGAAAGPPLSSSFYMAMRVLPREQRQAMYALYAFCHLVDEIADRAGARTARLEELDRWDACIDDLPDGEVDAALSGLRFAVARFDLGADDLHAVIDGVRMDVLDDIRAPSWETLDLYCDRVACAVGRLCVRIFGMEERAGVALAHHLGRALQLTNILRDLDEDAGMGRLYLPAPALTDAGLRPDRPLEAILADQRLDRACRRMAAHAQNHFSEADHIMQRCPRPQVRAPRLMALKYRSLLNRLITRGWQPPREAVASGKLRLAGGWCGTVCSDGGRRVHVVAAALARGCSGGPARTAHHICCWPGLDRHGPSRPRWRAPGGRAGRRPGEAHARDRGNEGKENTTLNVSENLSKEAAARQEREGLDPAIEAAADALQRQQHEDGHWRFELEADATIPAEYVLLLNYLGEQAPELEGKIAAYLRRTQASHGGWPLFPDGDADISATVKAYFALKLVGDDPQAPHMVRARRAVLDRGGAERSNVFTRISLALYGEVPWCAVPVMPVEIMLLPRWSPFHMTKVSYWARTVIVPLLVLQALKPRARNPRGVGVRELFASPPEKVRRWARGEHQSQAMVRLFGAVDAGLRRAEPFFPKMPRQRAIRAAEAFVGERLNGWDGLGAIFPAMANAVMMYDCLGMAPDEPAARQARQAVERLVVERRTEAYVQPCVSPVWDTVLSAHALLEVGEGAAGRHAKAGLQWLQPRQVRETRGDWIASGRRVSPGGWPFQYANPHYPDFDDTAVIVMGLDRASRRWKPDAGRDEAVRQGRDWIAGLQSSNGGWAAFDVDNTHHYLNNIPFADHGALIDPPTADVTARCVSMLAQLGEMPETSPVMARGLARLLAEQESDGSWFGRWGMNYIYGTWSALSALSAAGLASDSASMERGARWLISIQNGDGGWGESGGSYAFERREHRSAPSTASQTAWALLGLMAAGRVGDVAVRRGVAFLLRTQGADGFWPEGQFTATGFPRVFYLRYHGYPKYFPLWALARYRALATAGTVAEGVLGM